MKVKIVQVDKKREPVFKRGEVIVYNGGLYIVNADRTVVSTS